MKNKVIAVASFLGICVILHLSFSEIDYEKAYPVLYPFITMLSLAALVLKPFSVVDASLFEDLLKYYSNDDEYGNYVRGIANKSHLLPFDVLGVFVFLLLIVVVMLIFSVKKSSIVYLYSVLFFMCELFLFVSLVNICSKNLKFTEKISQFDPETIDLFADNYKSLLSYRAIFPELTGQIESSESYPIEIQRILSAHEAYCQSIHDNIEKAVSKLKMQKIHEKIEEEQAVEQKRQARMETLQKRYAAEVALKNGKIICPNCGSESVAVVKKGFSGGQAAVGAVLLGPLGLLAGLGGANDLEKVCLICKHKWS